MRQRRARHGESDEDAERPAGELQPPAVDLVAVGVHRAVEDLGGQREEEEEEQRQQ